MTYSCNFFYSSEIVNSLLMSLPWDSMSMHSYSHCSLVEIMNAHWNQFLYWLRSNCSSCSFSSSFHYVHIATVSRASSKQKCKTILQTKINGLCRIALTSSVYLLASFPWRKVNNKQWKRALCWSYSSIAKRFESPFISWTECSHHLISIWTGNKFHQEDSGWLYIHLCTLHLQQLSYMTRTEIWKVVSSWLSSLTELFWYT